MISYIAQRQFTPKQPDLPSSNYFRCMRITSNQNGMVYIISCDAADRKLPSVSNKTIQGKCATVCRTLTGSHS